MPSGMATGGYAGKSRLEADRATAAPSAILAETSSTVDRLNFCGPDYIGCGSFFLLPRQIRWDFQAHELGLERRFDLPNIAAFGA